MFFKRAALACLALSCTSIAVAETSSVQLYGVIDGGIRHEKRLDGSHVFGMASGIAGQSRFGMKGVEDLGGGLSATFTLEGGFLTTTGNSTQGRLFGRQATLGLKGGFGEVRIGRQVTFGYAWTPFIASPFGVAWSGNSIGNTFGYKSGDYGPDGRLSNAVIYETPNVSGFQAGIGYSFSTDDQQAAGSSNNNRVLTAGIRYIKGPLRAALTYDGLNPKKDSDKRKSQNYQLGVSYDFEVVRAFLGYNEQRKINNSPVPGYIAKGKHKDRAYSIGASVPIGAGDLMFNYQHAVLSKNRGVGAAYRYKLSKRTMVYAAGNYYKVRNFNLDENQNKHQLAVGIQHSF